MPEGLDVGRGTSSCRALKQGGVSDEEIDAYTRESTSRFYNHLVYTTITWVETH